MAPRSEFEKTVSDYRRRIVIALFKVLVIPPTLVALSAPLFDFDFLGTLALAIVSIPLTITLRSQFALWINARTAARLHAQSVTHVIGKWPGNLDIVLRFAKAFEKGYALQAFADLFAEYGCTTLNTRLFWTDQIITMDRDVIKFVSMTGFDNFNKGTGWHERFDKLLGTGLFNAEGDRWRAGRAMVRPFFSKSRVSDFNIFDRNSAAAMTHLVDRARLRKAFDAQDLTSRFTLESAAEFLFGVKLNVLERPLCEPGRTKLGPRGALPIDGGDSFDVFSEAFEHVAALITRRGARGMAWPLAELLGDATQEQTDRIFDWLEPLVQLALERKRQRLATGESLSKDQDVFLDFLANSTDDVEHIRYELVTYLIASRDTTASVLTFVLYFFALHPSVCKRAREEVLLHLGTTESPSYTNIKALKYLRAVINETLRLFPSAPLQVRMSKDAPLALTDESGRGLHLPPHTQVAMVSMCLQRRQAVWGADADEFNPDRWFDKHTLESVNASTFTYCPFSHGPRSCVGSEFAINEAMYFLCRTLQQFSSFKLTPEFQPEGSTPPAEWKNGRGRQAIERIWPSLSLTLHSKGGLWMFAELAD